MSFLVKDIEEPLSLAIDSEDTFSQIQASSVTYRFATGPNRGKMALVLKTISNTDHASGTYSMEFWPQTINTDS